MTYLDLPRPAHIPFPQPKPGYDWLAVLFILAALAAVVIL